MSTPTDTRTTGGKISDWMADRGTDLGNLFNDLGSSEKIIDAFKQFADMIHMAFVAMFDPETFELESAVRGWGKRDWERAEPEATYSHEDTLNRANTAQAPARQITPASALDLTSNFTAAAREPGWSVQAPTPEANRSFVDTVMEPLERTPSPMLPPTGPGGL